jgi:hypothetical protein
VNGEGRPQPPSQSAAAKPPTTDSFSHDCEIVPLRHGMAAVYIRDTDDRAVALRRMKRNRSLNAEQRAAYEAWIAEQRQDEAS